MKKLINSPDDVAAETMEGLLAAFPQKVKALPGIRAIIRRDAPIQGKVAVVTGGGIGHEPMWWCYVGRGMPDASVVGNVFAAPPRVLFIKLRKLSMAGVGFSSSTPTIQATY